MFLISFFFIFLIKYTFCDDDVIIWDCEETSSYSLSANLTYHKYPGIGVWETKEGQIDIIYDQHLFNCLYKCIKDDNCSYVVHESNKCKLYSTISHDNILRTNSHDFYAKPDHKDSKNLLNWLNRWSDQSLTHYWPITGNINDAMGQYYVDRYQNATLIADRFKKEKSAIRLKGGSIIMNNPIMHEGNFTLMSWIRFKPSMHDKQTFKEEIFYDDFKNFTRVNLYYLGMAIKKDANENEWFHASVVYTWRDSLCSIQLYLNAQIASAKNLPICNKIAMNGVHMYSNDSKAFLDIDDFKFFASKLSRVEIQTEMNSKETDPNNKII